jgi:hypothetical protein
LRDQQRGAQRLREVQQRRELELVGPPKDKSAPSAHVRQLYSPGPVHSSTLIARRKPSGDGSPEMSQPYLDNVPHEDFEVFNNSTVQADVVTSNPLRPTITQKRRPHQTPLLNSRKKNKSKTPPPGQIDEVEQKQYASLRVRICTQLNIFLYKSQLNCTKQFYSKKQLSLKKNCENCSSQKFRLFTAFLWMFLENNNFRNCFVHRIFMWNFSETNIWSGRWGFKLRI